MTLWTLERLRLLRTNRLLILLGAYLFFGVTGPLTARYLSEILARFGGGLEVSIPDATPPDGITQFTSNAGQLGLLAVVIVAAGALALDADREKAIFLRSRVRSAWQLLVPRVVTVSAAAVLALVVGTVVAAVLTVRLLGHLDLGALTLGTLYGALYLVLAVAVTAAVASVTGGVLSTVLTTVSVLIAMPILGLIRPIARWIPSELLGAVDGLIRGVPASETAPAAFVAVVVIAGLLVLTANRIEHREV